MIVLLNGANEAALKAICQSQQARQGEAGIIVVKEEPGQLRYWDTRGRGRFEPYNEMSLPKPYLMLGKAQRTCEETQGQVALWIRPDFDWTGDEKISSLLSSGEAVILSSGPRVPVDCVIDIRRRLNALDVSACSVLASLCDQKPDFKLSESHCRQLLAARFIESNGSVVQSAACVVLEMLST